jgi:hypothetical protein
MDQFERTDSLDELLTCRLDLRKRKSEPCTVVIFGASGDLTARKLIPALYHLFASKQMPNPFRIIGFARREKPHDAWRAELKEALEKYSRTKKVDPSVWNEFAANVLYCRGEFTEPAAYQRLGEMLQSFPDERLKKNLLYYLSTSPSQFAEVAEHLRNANLLRKDLPAEEGWHASSSRNRSAMIRNPRSNSIGTDQTRERETNFPHRPLPRQRNGAEHFGVPFRELDLRAALESPVRR